MCIGQAVVRGLAEELGIVVQEDNVQGPLTHAHLRKLDTPSGVHDHEFVESYRYVATQPVEVVCNESSAQAGRLGRDPQR